MILKKLRWLVLLLICISVFVQHLPSSSAQSVYSREDDFVIYVSNDYLEVGFWKETGVCWSLVHKASGIDLRGIKEYPGLGLWDLRLITENLTRLGPSGPGRSADYYRGYTVSQTAAEVTLEFEWTSIWLEDYGEYPARLIASVTISTNSPYAYFALDIENSGSAAIEEITYPHFWEVSQLGSESSDDVLIVPTKLGRLYRNPSENLYWWGQTYPSAYCSMQFIAYYDRDAGFYLATYDQEGYTKAFFWGEQNGFHSMGIVHYPAIAFSESYEITYSVVLGVFTGDWYTAADMYKEWAHQQWWIQKDTRPEWLRQIAVSKDFYCYALDRDRTFQECILKSKQHQEYFKLPTTLFLWGWEKGEAWAYGDYFPPYEGWDAFDELVDETHDFNTRLYLPFGGLGVLNISEPWRNESAMPYAMTNEDNSYVSSPSDLGALIYLCPFTDYWQNMLQNYTVTLTRHGIDLIQFDGFPYPPPQSCYNASHGHPVGLHGNLYAQSWINILNSTLTTCSEINPDVVFGGEGGNEIFLPFLDTYHSRDSWDYTHEYESVIPLFNYVYHEYVTFLGEHNLALFYNPNDYDEVIFRPYNLWGLAKILIWGEIPSYNMQESFDGDDVDLLLIDYVRKIGVARYGYAHRFLTNSSLIKPVEITSPIIRIQDVHKREFYHEIPSVLYSAWTDQEDNIGYILTNIANQTINLNTPIEVDLQTPYNVYVFRDGILKEASLIFEQSHSFSQSIDPLEILLLQFMPEDTMPPTGNAGLDQTIQEGELLNLNASASQDNRWIQKYSWTFIDQDSLQMLIGMTPSYTFHDPGNYTITLNVTDTSGLSDTDTLIIHVQAISESFEFPWIYIGGAAMLSFIIGYVILKRRQEP